MLEEERISEANEYNSEYNTINPIPQLIMTSIMNIKLN